MDAYLDHQAQQVDRARTFAEIRRIEERAGKMAQARPRARRGGAASRRADAPVAPRPPPRPRACRAV
jgi:hypothetical protein